VKLPVLDQNPNLPGDIEVSGIDASSKKAEEQIGGDGGSKAT
jgi:hypothetical protein